MLAVRDLRLSFEGRLVLDDVSLDVSEGEVVALLGPSGVGKSSLLRVIAGLQRPHGGTVLIAGRDVTDVPTHRRAVGMVFQDEQLFPHLDVGANVGFSLKVRRTDRSTMRNRVAAALADVGLAGYEHRDVTTLSGGEAKRVALARALLGEPRVLLLDEPLTGLDRDLHDRLALDLAALLRDRRLTTLLVTHDRHEAATIADRSVTLGR